MAQSIRSSRWWRCSKYNVWALVSGENILGEVVLTWKVGCDLQSRWQVALAKVKNDCQNIVMPGGVAPQGKGLLAGV